MTFWELLLIAVGLSMDAFAVSVCKGLAMDRATAGRCTAVGMWFGGFQMLMPLLGYFLGSAFAEHIRRYDHWIAFLLLALIGANMIREALSGDEDGHGASLAPGEMLLLAVATSIDALAVGVTFALLSVRIWSAAAFIGLVTFCLSFLGVRLGRLAGEKLRAHAQIAGGVILIGIGLRILVSHLLAG